MISVTNAAWLGAASLHRLGGRIVDTGVCRSFPRKREFRCWVPAFARTRGPNRRRRVRGGALAAVAPPRRRDRGAFQTGHYLTAFGIAINRIELKKDAKAMTLLGELYAGGLGVPQNDVKAADWYNLAADRGDREAMFARPSSAICSRPTISRFSTWKANCFRRISRAPPSSCVPPRKPAFRRRNTRSARSKSRAAASRKT